MNLQGFAAMPAAGRRLGERPAGQTSGSYHDQQRTAFSGRRRPLTAPARDSESERARAGQGHGAGRHAAVQPQCRVPAVPLSTDHDSCFVIVSQCPITPCQGTVRRAAADSST